MNKIETPNRPKLRLTAASGGAMHVVMNCRAAAKKAGWTRDQIDALTKELTAGDYDHVLQTALTYFEVS
jgi:hypothetical protein